jgi:RNA polymerase sigma factor (sigma-70 family)
VRDPCRYVLVVDGDRVSRARLTGVLQEAGYDAVGVVSAEEARTTIAVRRPDVVITDVRLPGVSGYELCRELRDEHAERIGIVFISGDRTDPLDRAAGLLVGADDYMVKPVDPGELLARVRRLESRSNERSTPQRSRVNRTLDALSGREREVLDLLAAGSAQDDIAQRLSISPKTVATHIQRVLAKLGVRSRTQAVALVLRDERDVIGHAVADVGSPAFIGRRRCTGSRHPGSDVPGTDVPAELRIQAPRA